MRIHDQVVTPGDRVDVIGTVVRTTTGFGLLHDGDPFGADAHTVYPAEAPMVVNLESSGRNDQAWGDVLGVRITAVGSFAPGRVHVSTFDTTTDEPGHDVDRTGRADPRPLPPVAASAEAARVAQPLWAAGVILGMTRSDDGSGGSTLWVVAHDVDRVTRALEPLYGHTLRVIQSPWDRLVYAEIERFSTSAEALGVLVSVENGVESDGIFRVTVTVRELTDELAASAAAIPDGPMRLIALVRPSPPASAPVGR